MKRRSRSVRVECVRGGAPISELRNVLRDQLELCFEGTVLGQRCRSGYPEYWHAGFSRDAQHFSWGANEGHSNCQQQSASVKTDSTGLGVECDAGGQPRKLPKADPALVQWRTDFRHRAKGRPAMVCRAGCRRCITSLPGISGSRQASVMMKLPSWPHTVIADCFHGLVRTQREMVYAVGTCPHGPGRGMVCTAKQQFATSLSGEQRGFIDAVARNGSARQHDSSACGRSIRTERHSVTGFHRFLPGIVTGGHTPT